MLWSILILCLTWSIGAVHDAGGIMFESSDDIWQTVDTWQRQIDLSYANSGLHSIIGAFDCNTSISNDAAIVPADDAPATGSCTPFVTKRSQQHSILFAVSIPWPSGIIVEENVFPTAVGHFIRSVSLQYSAVSVRRQWAVVYTLPLFTQEECDRFISAAEAFGTSIGGWGRSHNTRDELPSVDLPVGEVLGAEAAAELRSYIDSSVLLAMAQSFGLDHRSLQLRDMHIAKYNASFGQKRDHPAHKDKSMFSFVIALNSQRKKGHKIAGSFDGGGTRFTYLNHHINPPAGTAVYFHGKVEHEGVEIARGVRYIMVGFCEYDNSSEWQKRYSPAYDGHAFAAGVRNGDIIRAVQTCKNKQGYEVNTLSGESHHGEIRSSDSSGFSIVNLSKVFPNTSKAEWLGMAQSCESIIDSTVFVLERFL